MTTHAAHGADTDDLVVATHALTKRYGDRTAVDGVAMSVRRGEVYGFLGPNGAGKTTTIRMVLGLVAPTSGTVSLLGGAPGSPSVMARVGALVEGPGFSGHLSGRDNLRVAAHQRGLGPAAVDVALERVDLADRAGDRFRTYSLGMKQRLGVACALLGDPELVVLDEPTNGLDPAGMADMRRLLVALAAEGHTVLLSSHLLGEVQEVCDRVGVVAGGRLLAEGSVAELRGARTLRVRATPDADALTVAMRVAGDDAVRREPDGALDLDLPPDAAPVLVRELVAAGVDVVEVGVAERSLEQVFFEMTTRPAAGRTEVAA